jgi:mannonate dehydratase
MGEVGVPVLCYNFMPVFDWTRTDLALALDDGSTALAYDDAALAHIDLTRGTGDLPGWATAYTAPALAALMSAYRDVSSEQLWEHLAYFLERVVPAAESSGVKMAIHPDDPPWPIFGLPRIVTGGPALDRVVSLVDSPANGVTFSLVVRRRSVERSPGDRARTGARGRIHFAHCRNVRITGPRQFREAPHPSALAMSTCVRCSRHCGTRGSLARCDPIMGV